MAITVERHWSDASGGDNLDSTGSRQLRFIISGTDDVGEAIDALRGSAPGSVGPYTAVNWEIVERLTDTHWLGLASYGQLSGGGSGEPPLGRDGELSIDTTGGKTKVTHYRPGYRQHAYVRSGGDPYVPPEFNGAINVKEDAIEGVEIDDLACSIKISRVYSDAELPASYLMTVTNLTPSTNESTMTLRVNKKNLVFERGEVLYRGSQINYQRSSGEWRVVHNFDCKPNEENRVYGGITVPLIRGWEYVWVHCEKDNSQANWAIMQPRVISVGPVYREKNLNQLGA